MRFLLKTPHFHLSLRANLFVFSFFLLSPVLLMQADIYLRWYKARKESEILANLEIARALQAFFWDNIRNLLRQEYAVGMHISQIYPFSEPEASEFLTLMSAEFSYLRSILWADASGRFLAGSDRRAIGISIADRLFFQEIVKGKDYAISNLIPVGRVSGQMAFVVARGIRSSDGRLLGVVAASVNPQHLGELLFAIDRPKEGWVMVFDNEGQMVFSRPESDYLGKHYAEQYPALQLALRSDREVRGTFPPFSGSDKHIAALVPVADTHWVVSASRPTKEIMAPIRKSLFAAIRLNLLVIGFCGLLAYVIGRRLLLSVRTLESCARRIGEGVFDPVPILNGPSELQELRRAINLMSQQLHYRKEETERVMSDLDRSNKELERFAYIASHDLQEPLRMVAGFLQLLQRRYGNRLDAEADEYIRFAVEGAQRMKTLINDLLVFSRVGSRGTTFTTVACSKIVDEVLKNLQPAIQQYGAKVQVGELPSLRGDSTQLSQVFQNLVANALKFSRKDVPPVIDIGVNRNNGEWVFYVRDNGIGIPPQHYERIFAIFQRLHHQASYPGTGLGLAICRKVVELHGGRIWVESEMERGSTFYFSIPAGKGVQDV